MNIFLFWILTGILAYLLGSIPSAVWIGQRFYGIDIRERGSKNAGATNVLRVLGKKPALLVFVIDVLKSVIPVYFLPFLSVYLQGSEMYVTYQLFLGVMVVIGHIFPVFAQFRGGKGVATLLGVTLGIVPLATSICFLFFVMILLMSKTVSLSSLCTALFFCFYIFFISGTYLISLQLFAIMATILLFITHRKNITRLIHKEEPKIKF